MKSLIVISAVLTGLLQADGEKLLPFKTAEEAQVVRTYYAKLANHGGAEGKLRLQVVKGTKAGVEKRGLTQLIKEYQTTAKKLMEHDRRLQRAIDGAPAFIAEKKEDFVELEKSLDLIKLHELRVVKYRKKLAEVRKEAEKIENRELKAWKEKEADPVNKDLAESLSVIQREKKLIKLRKDIRSAFGTVGVDEFKKRSGVREGDWKLC